MEQVQTQTYHRVSLFSLVILVVLTWGFYRTYIVFFPAFEGFQPVHHFHGAIMLLWIGLLIIQPWLMSRKKYRIHKSVGRASFVIAPLVMVSIFMVSKVKYEINLQRMATPTDALAFVSLNIPPLFIFGALYALAVANRSRTYHHMRYMIGTAILMIGPGLGRALGMYFGILPPLSVSITLGAVALIALAFLIFDLANKRDYVPNLVVTGLMLLHLVLWQLRYTPVWQKPGEVFAGAFF